MKTSVILTAAAFAAASIALLDGRANRAPRSNIYSARSDTWQRVKHSKASTGWFKRHLRCSRNVFDKIVSLIETKWSHVNGPVHYKSSFDVCDRVAVALHYLTHADGFDQTAALFGTSKTRAHCYTQEVISILNDYILGSTIALPSSAQDWEDERVNFEAKAGIPNVYGAIDGCLIPIKRFCDFEGWYCRKRFPAFNLQAVVDSKLRFRSYALRSGSQNDKALFKNSTFGKTSHTILPVGGCFLADAGYKLYGHIITPYPIRTSMPDDEAHFNLLHSRTRIVVERAFGLWKNTFRIFKTPLLQSNPAQMAAIITATMVLHNLFIDFDDSGG
ncbi:hypothetical protein Ae201684P_012872 [Aphanomyces euteiches]|uniref:DDE Tnp4 domain-containing protein n=1 Tax=Aphanomyces euteiches TaxID=100861 RepID=A0A6G0XG76_9STRA|nr:hypothetical protein Ae201684_005103 [Aphanomyces euteiches]KAH9080732.1 hypothetical protein Ae201684P_012872 [Aphanomyces euteiches]